MKRKLIAANWKMNGALRSNAALLAGAAEAAARVGSEVLVCPPHPYLGQAAAAAAGTGLRVGAQNLSAHDAGAYTGEVSGAMLRDVGASHVIIGHSERRTLCGETDDDVAAKLRAARRHGLVPVVCVGESLAEREAGQAMAVLARQLAPVLAAENDLGSLVLAYEPVWAIGTGRAATPAMAQEIHQYLRQLAAQQDRMAAGQLRILYGGSVKASNAAELFAQADIDGALVGGASLDAEEFAAICRAAG